MTAQVARKQALQARIQAERRAVLVVNTRSRQGALAYRQAKELLAQRGIALDGAYPVRDPARLQEIVRGVVEAGHALVIVGGGDGTLSSVVDLFADRDVVLGLLPLGTANSFARELDLPLALEGAIDVIAQGRVADVDLARVDGDYFVNTATLGLAAVVARSTPHVLKRYLGKAGYVLVGAAKFLAFRPFRVRVTEGARQREFDALQVLLANGRYLGGVLVAGNASPESRSVLVQVITGRSRWNLVQAWWAVVTRRPLGPAIAEEFTVTDALIETEPRQYVSIDGEVAARTPVRLTVAREALMLMVPSRRASMTGTAPGQPLRSRRRHHEAHTDRDRG
jgi:YegS/Rv2252/BmrU family lipid kinase